MDKKYTVRSWYDFKNYGFLINPDGGKDIFVHSSDVPNRGGVGKRLKIGEKVSCEVIHNTEGPKGINIQF
jgi:cold shock protein